MGEKGRGDKGKGDKRKAHRSVERGGQTEYKKGEDLVGKRERI